MTSNIKRFFLIAWLIPWLTQFFCLCILLTYVSVAHSEPKRAEVIAGEVFAGEVFEADVSTLDDFVAQKHDISWGILGDSLSAAYNLPVEQGWGYLVNQRLRAYFEAQADIQFSNASISGATTDAGFAMLPGLLAKQPDLVVLELGANDGLQGKSLAMTQKNLERLLQQIQQSGAQVILVGVRLPPNLGVRYTEPFYQQFVTLSDKYQVPLVTFERDFSPAGAALMLPDGIHPNAKGNQAIADLIWLTLKVAVENLLTNKAAANNTAEN